ncbi:MAG: SPASM domain-containing protein, partial [Sutterellaceae bacterium]|nr:SPASM domain-containing protein [Sutterellaceae bacterium]
PHVDLAGNLSFCERLEHGMHEVSGTVRVPESLEERFYEHTVKLHEHCRQCSAFIYCHGQCPIEEPSKTPEQCRLLRIFYRHVNALHRFLTERAPAQLDLAIGDSRPQTTNKQYLSAVESRETLSLSRRLIPLHLERAPRRSNAV